MLRRLRQMGTTVLVDSSYSKRPLRALILVGVPWVWVQRPVPRVPRIPWPQAQVSAVTRPS